MKALVAALLAAVFLSPALFFGQVPTFRDFVNVWIPYRLYGAHALGSGRLPLWAPEPSLGAPFLANYQSAVFYPPSAIVDLLPGPSGLGLYLWLHFFVGALGIAALLESQTCSRAATIFGGIVYVFGGFFVSSAGWNHLVVAAWMPPTLVAARALALRPSGSRWIALTLLLAIQALGGAPELFAQAALLMIAWALLPGGGVSRGRRAVLIGTSSVMALSIAGAQLLPTLEYFLETSRAAGLPAEEALTFSLSPQTLWTLVFPHRLDGGIVAPVVDGRISLYWSLYVGIAPLILAVVALGSRAAAFWAACLVAAVVLAMGSHTPVYPSLYALLPALFGAFRYPEKFLLLGHLSVAILAGIGCTRLEGFARRSGRLSSGLVAAALCVVTTADLWDVHLPSLLFADWRQLESSAPPEPLRGAGVEARIFGYEPTANGLRPWAPKFTVGSNLAHVMRFTWSDLGANVALVYGIGFVNGMDSFHRRSFTELYRQLEDGPLERDVRLLRTYGARFWIGERPLAHPELTLVREGAPGRTWIYRAENPAPRAYLARSVRFAAGTAEALAIVGGEEFTAGEDAVVEGAERDARPLGNGSARIIDAEAERLVVELQSDGPGLLVVNDSFFPGWIADLDGEPATILRANGLVRGVEVPAGRHRVTFAYVPRWFRIGCWVSLASLLLLWPLARVLTSSAR